MPKPYFVGWKDALDWWFTQFKRSGFKIGWKRRKMFSQLVHKKLFWKTPEERAQETKEALNSLKDYYNKYYSHTDEPVDDEYTDDYYTDE